ncbi:MAG: glycosyltransferase family 39 protein [Thermoanaerobaculia bacterium]|nr:glycosyltransferase family 39 protein [Thermoanaerobaculia bacterium]
MGSRATLQRFMKVLSWGTTRGALSLGSAIAVGFAVRAIALGWVGDLACTNDECSYLRVAGVLLDGGGLGPVRGFLWAPGYPFFLALAGKMGEMAVTAKVLQVFLASATQIALFSWVRRCFDERIALGSVWIFALYPTLVAFTHYLWSETLYLFLLVAAVAVMFAGIERTDSTERRRSLLLAASGLLFGLAALVRPVALYFLVLWLPWLAFRDTDRIRGRRTALAIAFGCLAAVAPWTVRNAVVYRAFVPIDATLGVNLWRGNANPAVANWDFGFDRRPRNGGAPPGFAECKDSSFIDRDRCNVSRSLATIARSPATFLRRVPTKLLDLVNPTSFLVRHARWGLYGPMSLGSVLLLTLLVVISYTAVVLAAAAGLIAFPNRDLPPPSALARQLVIALILYTLALHAITFGMSRFRLPLLPFLFPFAALAWSRWREALAVSTLRRRAVLLTWALLILAWAWRMPPLLRLNPPVTGPPSRLTTVTQPISATQSPVRTPLDWH